MSWFEMVLMIKDYVDGDIEEAIQICNELLVSIDDKKKAINDFSTAIEEFAEIHKRCPLCGSELEYIKDGEEVSEYFGREVGEEVGHMQCSDSDCSYTD